VLQAGDIVAARRPDRPSVEMIKRIESLLGPDQYFLTGDNPDESTDSRHFGPVPVSQITGLVRWRYWPLPPRRLG
jgi:type IV secretory pathway protease TraF